MTEQTDLWPVAEILPNGGDALSPKQLSALAERIVDPTEMDRLRMLRIRYFNHAGDSWEKGQLINAQMADLTNPEPPEPEYKVIAKGEDEC